MNEWVKSIGLLRYSIGGEGPRLVVEVAPDISRLARSLIPRSFLAQGTRYPPHITVVRNEDVADHPAWMKRDGDSIQFSYSSMIYNDEVYFWHRVHSDLILDVRVELGLPLHTDFTRAPDGHESFHITVANRKNVRSGIV